MTVPRAQPAARDSGVGRQPSPSPPHVSPTVRHYLDHASTTTLRPEAADAMGRWLQAGLAADPGRLHLEGRHVRAAIEDARDQVAHLFHVRSRQVVFTSSGTEAVATAVWGATRRCRGGAVLCPAIEHSCVLKSSALFGRAEIVPVGPDGVVDVGAFSERLREVASSNALSLAHCQVANHEVGAIQPVADLAAICHDAGVLFHSDAAAAAGYVPVDVPALGADLVSVSSHKLGGPPGVGALIVRPGLRVEPLLQGGSQERSRRAGMENVPGIVGFGAASDAVRRNLDTEAAEMRSLTALLVDSACGVGGISLVGPADPSRRLPHIACLAVDGVLGEAVLLGLESEGVAVHSGSACASESFEPSEVLSAMGLDAERTLRASVGWSSSVADVDALSRALPEVVARLRALAG